MSYIKIYAKGLCNIVSISLTLLTLLPIMIYQLDFYFSDTFFQLPHFVPLSIPPNPTNPLALTHGL
jgi:hypothetical protein